MGLPVQAAALIDGGGRATPAFYRFLAELASYIGNSDVASQLTALAERVDTLEATSHPNIIGPNSVVATQSGANWIVQLRGDRSNPSNGMVYGANAQGPGWVQISELDGAAGIPYLMESTYTVPENIQVLFTLPIELSGDAELIVEGALVEVS